MMGHREELKGGDEWDFLNRYSRRFHFASPGEIRRIKSRFNRRVRRQVKQEICRLMDE